MKRNNFQASLPHREGEGVTRASRRMLAPESLQPAS
jgi:hypothetical protein